MVAARHSIRILTRDHVDWLNEFDIGFMVEHQFANTLSVITLERSNWADLPRNGDPDVLTKLVNNWPNSRLTELAPWAGLPHSDRRRSPPDRSRRIIGLSPTHRAAAMFTVD
jgi:hypothetical protein